MGYITELDDAFAVAHSESGHTITDEYRNVQDSKKKALEKAAKITIGIGIGVAAAAAIVKLAVVTLRGRGRRP